MVFSRKQALDFLFTTNLFQSIKEFSHLFRSLDTEMIVAFKIEGDPLNLVLT